MRYEEITEFRSRNETQIFRALLQQYSRPLSDSLAEYNKAIQLAKINTPALTTVNVVRDPMFQSMARTMFRMGIGKKDAGKFLSRDEPADQLRLIKSFSEKNWLQVLRTKGGISGIKTTYVVLGGIGDGMCDTKDIATAIKWIIEQPFRVPLIQLDSKKT